jgi:DNA-binding transcriptional LysR family regulator
VDLLDHTDFDMSKKLDLNLLQTLEALLAERNVTRAAARLHTTQPALSAQLARLRQMFDDPLLIPGSRGMTPTPRALELEPLLSELMSGLRAVVHPQRFDPATSEATILFAATDSVHYIVAPYLAELHRMAPRIRLAAMPVMRLSKPEIERHLATGQLDIVIGLVNLFPDDLRIREVSQDEYVCVMRRDHPFRSITLDLDDFCNFEHVYMSPLGGEFSGDVDAALLELGRERKVIASVPSALVATRILETSDFVAVFPQYLATREAHILKYYPLPVAIGKLKLSMAWHERTHLNPAHQWFRERIVRLIRRLGQEDAQEQLAHAGPAPEPLKAL